MKYSWCYEFSKVELFSCSPGRTGGGAPSSISLPVERYNPLCNSLHTFYLASLFEFACWIDFPNHGIISISFPNLYICVKFNDLFL